MTQTLRFLVLFELLSLIGAPLAMRVLGRLPGAGLGLAKILAWLLLAWLVWMLGSLGIPNGLVLVLGCLLALAGLSLWLHRRRDRGTAGDPFRRRLFVASEAIFVVSFLIAALLGSYSADVWGTEKPMDMMLINSTLADGDFPPRDPWLSGADVNYYYLGQHMAALTIRLTGVEPTAGYNLVLAALMAITMATAFALAATIAEGARRQGMRIRRPLLAGGLCVVLLALMGSWAGGRAALRTPELATFDWFTPSRVIPNTINEFPFFSWTVGDLHAHYLAVPLTLLALAFIVQAGLKGPPRLRSGETFCAALAIGWLYAVNSWSWPVMVGTLVLTVGVWITRGDAAGARRAALSWTAIVIALGAVLVLPFIVNFDPNTRGLALTTVVQREGLGAFVKHHIQIEGVLLLLLFVPLLARLADARHGLRILVWGAGGVALALAILEPSRLGGAVLVAVLLAATLAAALARRRLESERVLWILAASALACLLGAELGVVRDEFAGGELERMNTVFKLGYQAWVLLAVFGAVALAGAAAWVPRRLPRAAWALLAAIGIGVSLAYPVAATYSARGAFKNGSRLDGREWLARTAPGDVEAIDWIRAELPGDAVIVEAVGDDYSPFGYARISTYTGRPTLLGWPGHELQWSHDLGTRGQDVQTIYTTPDAAVLTELLDRYEVDYAIVGPLERTTYGEPGALVAGAERVFADRGTELYRLR
ncbi:MAG: DUF2298 domain-containing protein [Solirubrobacteraceae bacterium]